MSQSLKQKTVKGTIWSTLERFSVQAVSFIVMIIMARILTPKDYGLVGMLTIFIDVSQSLVDSGFSQALIRKQNRTQLDNCTVFFFNIGIGIILYLILFLCAPLISMFYNEPMLTPLMRVIGLSVFINSFVVVQRALLMVKIDFKTQAKASLAAAITAGGLGIAMAYTGYGVWSIVAYQIMNLAVNVTFLWFFSKWRPSWEYSWASFKELFSFGSKLAVSGIIDTLYRNIYLLVIGKVYKASDLGYYTRAQQFGAFPSSNLTGILQRVTFPVLCTIQDDDMRLSTAYRKFLSLSGFVVFPMMVGLAVLAKPLVLLLLNEQWLFTSTLLSILCFAMMWFPIHAINLNLLQVKGRSDLFLKLEIWKKCIGVAILCITVPFGLVWMCLGSVGSSIIALVINTYYTGKLIGLGFFKQMMDLIPTLLVALAMGCIVWVVTSMIEDNLWQLIIGIITGTISYFGISYLIKSKDFSYIKELKRNRL